MDPERQVGRKDAVIPMAPQICAVSGNTCREVR
jgi:hypothetical protein